MVIGMSVRPLEVVPPTGTEERAASSSVDKAAALLLAFARTGGCATLTELAREAGIPKSTAHRLLGSLKSAGLVDRNEMDWYLLGPLARLGTLALRGETALLREVALPYMVELYEDTHENVHLAMLDSHEIVYLEKVYGHRSTPSPSRVGRRAPCHTSGLGKAMLAFSDESTVREIIGDGLRPMTPRSIVLPRVLARQLEAIRDTGVAFDLEETREGLTCVAVPIISPAGRPVAAVSVAGSSRAVRPEVVAPKLLAAAKEIGRKAGPDVELLATGLSAAV
jgi:DNA-binding IclR family transcriptional regulator